MHCGGVDVPDYFAEHGEDMIPVKLIDLVSIVVRLKQTQRDGIEFDNMVHERVFTCDLPRLEAYLPDECKAEIQGELW